MTLTLKIVNHFSVWQPTSIPSLVKSGSAVQEISSRQNQTHGQNGRRKEENLTSKETTLESLRHHEDTVQIFTGITDFMTLAAISNFVCSQEVTRSVHSPHVKLWVSQLAFWAESTTKNYIMAKTMFSLSPIYFARKSSNHKLSKKQKRRTNRAHNDISTTTPWIIIISHHFSSTP